MSRTRRRVKTEHLVTRTLITGSSHAPACGSSLGFVAPLRILKVIHSQHVFIHHSLICPTHFLPFVPRHLRTSQTTLPITGIRKSPCAPPHGGFQFGRLVKHNPLTCYEPKTCIEVSSKHTPINYASKKNSCNTDYNDLTTTVEAETPDTKEVGQSTSPLFSQEREVSSNPFCVSGFQQQEAVIGGQQQASSSVINSWLGADLWGARKLVLGSVSFSSVEKIIVERKERSRSRKCPNSV